MFFFYFLSCIYLDDIDFIYSQQKLKLTNSLLKFYELKNPVDWKDIAIRKLLIDISTGERPIYFSPFEIKDDLLIGLVRFFSQDYTEAQKKFTAILHNHPNPPLALLYFLGWSLYMNGDHEASFNTFLNLYELSEGKFDSLELKFMLAHSLYELGKYNEAFKWIPEDDGGKWFKDYLHLLKASLHYKLDSLNQAKKELEKIKENPWAKYLLGLIYIQEGELQKAKRTFDTQWNKEFENKATYAKALIYFLERNYKKTSSLLKENLRNLQGKDKEVSCLLLALAFNELNKFEDALKILKETTQESRVYKEYILRELIHTAYNNKDYSTLFIYADSLKKLYPGSNYLLFTEYLEAEVYLKLGNSQKAESIFLSLLNKKGSAAFNAQLYIKLGDIYYIREDYKKALSYYQRPELSIYQKEVHRKQLDCLLKLKDYKNALHLVSKMINLTSGKERDRLLLRKEWLKWRLGNYPNALAYLREYLKLYPHSSLAPEVLLDVADALFKERKFTESIFELKKLVQRYPFSPESKRAKLLLARAKLEIGKIQSALEICDDLLNENKLQSDMYLQIVELYKEANEYERAIRCGEELMKKYPASREALLAQYQLANIYKDLGYLKEAYFLYEEILNKAKDYELKYKSLISMLEIKLITGDLEEGKVLVKKGKEKFGDKPELLLFSGRLKKMEGDFKKAYQELLKGYKVAKSSELRFTILSQIAEISLTLSKREEIKSIIKNEILNTEKEATKKELMELLKKMD